MKEIIIPEDVSVDIEKTSVKVRGPLGQVGKKFNHPGIGIKKEGEKVKVEAKTGKKEIRAIESAYQSHIENMFKGVTEGFEYKLKVFYSHFPVQVKVEGNKVLIENFAGENRPRSVEILDGAEVEVRGEEISVKGPDKEAVGQTAANIQQATRIKGKDPRVFQDGIYVVEKGTQKTGSG